MHHIVGRRLTRPTRGIVLPVLAAVALFITLSAWGVSSPVGSSPDDDFHLSTIWCVTNPAGPECNPVPVKDPGGATWRLVPQEVGEPNCYAGNVARGAGCAEHYAEKLVGGRTQPGLYPWGFHEVMHLMVGDDVARSVLAMRVFNAGLAALLLGLALGLTSGALRRAAALSWIAVLTPLSLFMIPSTNPTSWAIIAIGTYWVFLLRYLRAPRGPGGVAAGGLSVITALIAAMARTDSTAYICVVTAACLLVSVRRPRDLLEWRFVLPVVIGLAAFIRFCSLETSGVLSGGLGPYDASLPGRDGLVLLLNNVMNLPSLLVGMLGLGFGLGWIDTPMPAGVGGISCAIAGGVVMLCVRSLNRRRVAASVLIFVVMVALALLILQQSHAFVGESIQPRYFLPLLAPMLGLLIADDDFSPAWLPKAAAWLLVLGAAFTNSVGLFLNLKRYIVGLTTPALNLDHHGTWWWNSSIPPLAIWTIGSVAGLALFIFLAAAARRADRSHPAAVGATLPVRREGALSAEDVDSESSAVREPAS